MRVAVCLFGEIRGNPEVWQRVQRFIAEKYNADVFMHHVYYDDNFIEQLNHTPEEKEFYRNHYNGKGVHFKPPKELFNIFKPVKLLFEKRPVYSYKNFEAIAAKCSVNSLTPLKGVNKMQYHMIMNQAESRKKSLQLKTEYEKEQNFKYDIVVQTRIDINILNGLTINPTQNSLKAKYCGGRSHIFEQIIYGPSDLMNVVGEFFDNADALYIRDSGDKRNIMMNEYFLGTFLSERGVFVEHCEVPLSYNNHSNGLFRTGDAFY